MADNSFSIRPLRWIASSYKDFSAFPESALERFGFELYLAQSGQYPPSAKPLKGLGANVVELRGDFDGDTYRAVYTVRFKSAVYVLHAFKKKSHRGIKTDASDIELIKRRLLQAQEHEAALRDEDGSK